MEYAIGVIDIGMTNKKVAIYNSALEQIDAVYHSFSPKMIDGIETHDLETMEEWFITQLGNFAKKYPIKVLSVSAHGGTFTCLDKDGRLTVPCVYYTHDPGEEFHHRFYQNFGSIGELQVRTGTPNLKSLINAAKGFFFVKEKYFKEIQKTALVLLYPQYWGYRFTGKTGIESTYLGCHTYLWDQVDSCFSSVAEDLKITGLMPRQVRNSWDILGTITGEFAGKTGLDKNVIVTMGIHDSNSSLLPYFAKKGETGFIVNSTGTWCVLMNPVRHYGITPEEIGKMMLFNISAFGKPIKTAIFQGGQEFETWSRLFKDFHKRHDIPPYDEELYKAVLLEKNVFLLPELTPGSGQFPSSKARIVEKEQEFLYADIVMSVDNQRMTNLPECFRQYEQTIALLRISLALQTIAALERVGRIPGIEIFIEGNFRKDKAFNMLLSAFYPENRIYLSDIGEATALGAAMIAKMAVTGKSLADLSGDFEIEYHEVEKTALPELPSYWETWMKLAES